MPRISNTQIIHHLPEPALSVRAKIKVKDLKEYAVEKYNEILEYIKELNEPLTGIPFIIYHDFRKPADVDMDIEIVFPVTKELPGEDDIHPCIIPENKLVFSMYQGSPDHMDPFYDELERWIDFNDFEIIGPSYEYYYSWDEFGVNNQITKVAIPIIHKSRKK